MSEDDNGRSKRDWAKLISLIIAFLTLIFGNNLYQQWTGHSFLGDIRPKTQPTATKTITPTPVPTKVPEDPMAEGPSQIGAITVITTTPETYWFRVPPPDGGWRVIVNQNRKEILASSVVVTRPISIHLIMQTGWVKKEKQSAGDEVGLVVLGFSNDKPSSLPITLSMLRQETDKDYFVVDIPDKYRDSTLTSVKVVFTAFPSATPKEMEASLQNIDVLALR